MIRKYILTENKAPDMFVGRFRWHLDDNNNAIVEWEWPANRMVRLMLVFEIKDDNEPDIAQLIEDKAHHDVITRELASRFTKRIPQEQRRFMICPAYFEENHSVVVYQPTYVTDWLYKKTKIMVKTLYEPLPFGQYQKVTFQITTHDATQLPLISEVMQYVIHDNENELGHYPIDKAVMAGAAHFYIKKDHSVKCVLDDEYAHLLDIRNVRS